jgi:class 3 adenylate cyclase
MGQVLNVSVLFTDLVGSTALSASVSPEAADQLRREHFGVLRRAVAEADGTEVKNLGDGLMVVFPTASAALACAVGMQQATELDNRGRDVPFGLRVGLSSGEAVEEDGDYFGDPVVEAARLCARCEAGEVLATDLVRAMAGRRNPHRCESVGDLELKGLPEPVATVQVCWEPVGEAETAQRVPLPRRLLGRPASGLVGRSVELDALIAACKRTAAGDGREAVVVSGEAGLGKTTLVADVARSAFDAGACVLFGHAEEDLATPYGLFAEALGHLVTHAADDDLRAYVADCGTDLVRIVPALARRLPEAEPPKDSDAETERYLLFASVVGLVRHVAQERPVVLVVDDLQWADTGSLQLLRHLLGDDLGMRLLVLATFRDTEVAAGHPLVETLAGLWRMDRVSRVDLQGLDDRGVIDLLEATSGQELDDAGVGLAHALYRETDGNPFFVSEVLRHLVETGALYQDETGRWVSNLTVDEVRLPDSVREVIGARVTRLGPQAGRVLSTAAVIGRDFDLELLARASDTDEDDLLDLLEAAETAALVRAPATVAGRFTFTHALIQRTLYQDLSANRRARAHERIAEALEDLTAGAPGERVGELAHHWAQAMRPADNAKALDYAMQAGAAAFAALAPAEAIRWYAQALDLMGPDGDPHQRAQLLVGLGEAQRDDGRPEFRETLLEAARLADKHDDIPLLARAAIANNRGWYSAVGGTDDDRILIIDRALERLDPSATADRARLLALAAVENIHSRPLHDRVALTEAAVDAARTSGDQHALTAVLIRAVAVAHPSTLELRTAWLQEACALADATDDRATRAIAHLAATVAACERADRDATRRHLSAVEDTLRLAPVAAIRWLAYQEASQDAILAGDLVEAERLAEVAFAFGTENGQPDALTVYGGNLVNIRHHQGRAGECIPLMEIAITEYPGLPVFEAALILPLAREGQTQRAAAILEAHVASGLQVPEDNLWSTAHASWADAAVLLEHAEAASMVRERILPFSEHFVASGGTLLPVLANYLGKIDHLLGQHDEAEAWFDQALAIHQRLESPLFVAYTHSAWASLLADRERGADHDRARTMAHAALDAATAGGYGYIVSEARTVLEQLQ